MLWRKQNIFIFDPLNASLFVWTLKWDEFCHFNYFETYFFDDELIKDVYVATK